MLSYAAVVFHALFRGDDGLGHADGRFLPAGKGQKGPVLKDLWVVVFNV